MAKAIFGFNYATHRDADEYSGAYDNANYTVKQAGEILSDGDYEHAAERKDVYERAFANSPEDFAQTFSIIDRMEKVLPFMSALKKTTKETNILLPCFAMFMAAVWMLPYRKGTLFLILCRASPMNSIRVWRVFAG